MMWWALKLGYIINIVIVYYIDDLYYNIYNFHLNFVFIIIMVKFIKEQNLLKWFSYNTYRLLKAFG